jgi:hypothetical protein
MSKVGETGTLGLLRRIRDLGNSIKLLNASLYSCLRSPEMNPF